MALRVERCPETGICSLFRPDGGKVDLMPDEVEALRDAAADPARARAVVAESDAAFAAGMDETELAQLAASLAAR